jgi:hypothetical protein
MLSAPMPAPVATAIGGVLAAIVFALWTGAVGRVLPTIVMAPRGQAQLETCFPLSLCSVLIRLIMSFITRYNRGDGVEGVFIELTNDESDRIAWMSFLGGCRLREPWEW